MLGSMNSDKLKTIIESVFVMYILLSFLDQITGFASKLVGGMELKSDWGGKDGMADMVKKTAKGLRSIQKRGVRAAKKHGMAAAKSARGGVKAMANAAGNKGKAVADSEVSKDNSDSARPSEEKSSDSSKGGGSSDSSEGGGSSDSSKGKE